MGDPVRLECDFEEGRDQLYSVKWYKDNMEFYRSALRILWQLMCDHADVPQVCAQGPAQCPEFPGGGGEGGHGELRTQLSDGQQRDQGHSRHRHVRGQESRLVIFKSNLFDFRWCWFSVENFFYNHCFNVFMIPNCQSCKPVMPPNVYTNSVAQSCAIASGCGSQKKNLQFCLYFKAHAY